MLVSVLILASSNVFASAATDVTATCLADSTSGKDRKLLARWIFLAMARHPAIEHLSKATATDSEDANREMGALFTRLVAVDCAQQIKAMVAAEGPSSMETSFELLGKIAMQELMTDPKVGAAFAGIDDYIDQEKVGAVVAPAK